MENKSKLKVEFKYAKDYKATYVAGVIGNATPDGLVMCDFYTEGAIFPSESELDIASGGIVEEKFKINAIRREAQFQMVVTPQKARVIAQWLLNAADQAEVVLKTIIAKDSRSEQLSKAAK